LGLEISLDAIAEIIRTKGSFVGIIGFINSGAGVALLVVGFQKAQFPQLLPPLSN
jgi:hypothetical protein